MNSYLEMPMWELRQAWDNFVNAKAVDYDDLEDEYD